MTKFAASTVSDQKRLARGEHWLFTRSLLRAWHRTHRSDWRIMTLAGGAPKGEFDAIKELMPSANITAVDKDQACIEAAIEDGADDVICADLTEWSFLDGSTYKRPTAQLVGKSFDVVNLDLCGGASEATRDMINVYRGLVARPGVLKVTFSYGRDVVEFFKFRQAIPPDLEVTGMPQTVAARLAYLLGPHVDMIASVILYSGNEMPMCSVVIECPGKGNRITKGYREQRRISFTKLQDEDFELAVLHPDVRLLYDCPQERIDALRRSHAALKAVATRKAKATNSVGATSTTGASK